MVKYVSCWLFHVDYVPFGITWGITWEGYHTRLREDLDSKVLVLVELGDLNFLLSYSGYRSQTNFRIWKSLPMTNNWKILYRRRVRMQSCRKQRESFGINKTNSNSYCKMELKIWSRRGSKCLERYGNLVEQWKTTLHPFSHSLVEHLCVVWFMHKLAVNSTT